MDVMPVGLASNRTSQYLVIDDTNMADEWTCEVASTLAPLTVRVMKWCMVIDFGKHKLWFSNSLCILKQHGGCRKKGLGQFLIPWFPMRTNSGSYHRPNARCAVFLLIYITRALSCCYWFASLELDNKNSSFVVYFFLFQLGAFRVCKEHLHAFRNGLRFPVVSGILHLCRM
jgi:hypothetical protein